MKAVGQEDFFCNEWTLPNVGCSYVVYTTKIEVDHNLWGVYQEDVQLCLSG